MTDDITNAVQAAAAEKIRRRLRNKALHYLERYSSTEAKLTDILQRFAMRKITGYSTSEVAPHIHHVVSQCVTLGYIDDRAFAESKWQAGLRNGRSPQMLAQKLKLAGVNDDIIHALRTQDAESADTELHAAIISARKRRIGPFAKTPPADYAEFQKQLARLVRAGFSLSVARTVMNFETAEAAEDVLHGKSAAYP